MVMVARSLVGLTILILVGVLVNGYLLTRIVEIEQQLAQALSFSYACPPCPNLTSALPEQLAVLRAASLQSHLLLELLAEPTTKLPVVSDEEKLLHIDPRRDVRNFLTWFDVQLQKQYAHLFRSDQTVATALQQQLRAIAEDPGLTHRDEWSRFLQTVFEQMSNNLLAMSDRIERNEVLVPSIQRGMKLATFLLEQGLGIAETP